MSDSNISSIAKEVVNQYKKATASSNLPVLQKRLSEVKRLKIIYYMQSNKDKLLKH